MIKYIDTDKLKEKIYAEDTVSLAHGSSPEFDQGCHYAFLTVLSFLDSLQQEQDLIIINKKDWEAQEQLRKNKDFGKPLQQEQDYSDLSGLERAIHRGFLCAGVENVPVAIIKETAKEVQSILKAEG